MIIPGFMIYALVSLAGIPEGVHKLKIQNEGNVCLAYDRFKEDVARYKALVLNDKIPYLSWKMFVRLKEDGKILELENQCNGRTKVDRN